MLINSLDTGYGHIPEKKLKYTEVITEVTAYTASIEECGKDDGITASGIKAIEGITIAADDLPFGTKVEIDGQIFVVHDRFGGNYRNRIDIYMVDVSRAWEFGRHRKIVKILEDE
jgi:3D (Asp-Asp-Asp) domain-containing protein